MLAHLLAHVALQLGRNEPRLDHCDAHVPLGDLLAQRLAERHHAELGRGIYPDTAAGDASGGGTDVDQIGDAAWGVFRCLEQVWQGRVRGVE